MSYYLSVDNLIGVQPTTTSSTNLQTKQIDIYNGTTNFHRLTSSASTPLVSISFPDASGVVVVDTATQTITNKLYRAQFGTAGNTIYGSTTGTQGMYFGLNQVSISTNSAERLRVIDTRTIAYTPITLPDQTSITPSIHFNSSVSSGIYYGGSNQVAISSNGNQVAGFETGGMKLYNTSITGYTPSLLGFYHEATQNCTMTNGGNSQTLSLSFTRIGRLCNIRIPYFNTTNNNGLATNPTISFNISPINNLYTYNTPWGGGAYFSVGLGYGPGRTRIFLQLVGTNLYFFIDNGTTIPSGTYFEHLGSTITYIFT